MTAEELRESAISGAGPLFRGRRLQPAIEHMAILERSRHPIATGAEEMSIDQACEFLFLMTAEWETVFAAANTDEDGRFGFSLHIWKFAVDRWLRELPEPVTPDEVREVRAWARVLHDQIRAAEYKHIDTGQPASKEPEPGN